MEMKGEGFGGGEDRSGRWGIIAVETTDARAASQQRVLSFMLNGIVACKLEAVVVLTQRSGGYTAFAQSCCLTNRNGEVDVTT